MFSYDQAFSRNIGWLTTSEQQLLRSKRVAIAGLGGVGGSHLLTLSRLGIGKFNLADFDQFEQQNFNRQAGAMMSTLGQNKLDTLTTMALDINPELDIRRFPDGIDKDSLADFFSGVDLYVDGLDFFAFPAREAAFAYCAQQGIPAITVAPLGLGAALLNFLPGGMSFEHYFCLEGQTDEEKALRFFMGLAPAGLQGRYLVDPTSIDLANQRGPSTAMACQLCSGIAATEALKILVSRGKVYPAPHGIHFDAYLNRVAHTWRPGGNRNPLQRLALAIARKKFAQRPTTVAPTPPASILDQILDTARWAPSGDNTQPWRFEVLDEHHVAIHGFDTRSHCVYDLQGHASQLSHGTLLESIKIAASGFGLATTSTRREDTEEDQPIYDVRFTPDQSVAPDALIPYLPLRSVQRRPLQTRHLLANEKQALEAALGDNYEVIWLEGWRNRLKAARLMFLNSKLRLTMPEAYRVHHDIIEWNARFSEDRVPDQAVGLDPLTTRLMAWVMGSWQRVRFFNKYLAGTLAPRIQLDLIPGLACAAHFIIVAKHPPQAIDDYVNAGSSVQRFWLTATRLGLQLQPEMTPLIFSSYVAHDLRFSSAPEMWKLAGEVSDRFQQLCDWQRQGHPVFMGRIGAGERARARSLRLPLGRLMAPR